MFINDIKIILIYLSFILNNQTFINYKINSNNQLINYKVIS